MSENTRICDGCESEFIVETIHSFEELTYCPFCGEELTETEEDE